MSAQVQLQPIRRSIGTTVTVVVLAFAVATVATLAIGSMIRSSSVVETTTPAPLWDTGRLEAMDGRQLAESVGTSVRWDAGMLEAMEGRQLAEAGPVVSDSPVVYDSWMGEANRSLIGEFSRGQR